MLRTTVLSVVLVASAGAYAEENRPFFFRPGDRVLFLGDSITEQYQYSSIIELFLTTRFPDSGMSFVNAGIGGDTATGGARRFASHVLAEKPTCITINFGMNDGGYKEFKADRADAYVRNTKAMLEAAKKAHIRVALLSPNAVEVRNKPDLKTYLETQKRFYAPLKELADRYDARFVDQYAVTRKVLEKLESEHASIKPFPDAVHTNLAGGLLMAHTILVGLGAPARIGDATIDAATGRVTANGCEVSGVSTSPEAVRFNRKDSAVPLPILKEWTDLLPYLDNLKDLNWCGLTVKGLKDGKYELLIDGSVAGSFSADELSAGVNLGSLTGGPIFEQGRKLFTAINDKNKLVHSRFRQVVMYQAPDWAAEAIAPKRIEELARRADAIATKQAAIDKLAKPAAHTIELKAVK